MTQMLQRRCDFDSNDFPDEAHGSVAPTNYRLVPREAPPTYWARPKTGSSRFGIDGYVHAKLRELQLATRHQSDISAQVLLIVDSIMSRFVPPEAVFPFVELIEGGGISLFWTAGPREIEIEVDADRGVYLRIVDDNGQTLVNDLFEGKIRGRAVRQALQELTDAVERVNPGWRRLFAR